MGVRVSEKRSLATNSATGSSFGAAYAAAYVPTTSANANGRQSREATAVATASPPIATSAIGITGTPPL